MGCSEAVGKERRRCHPCQCLWTQRCPRGFKDSWAGQAEPFPPLRSANPWQGAHRALGLHLLRPEAGNARPTALTFSGSVVYRVVSHPQPNLHTSLHRARAQLRKTGSREKAWDKGAQKHVERGSSSPSLWPPLRALSPLPHCSVPSTSHAPLGASSAHGLETWLGATEGRI